ncbi:MAG: hypothetical protein O6852_02100, partial [Gammaproteobacteria bacterium]|nr:hypothetical protein [Gammaproteobacteria bacterium]
MEKLLFLLFLFSSQAGAVTWDYILDFEDATASDIGDTTTLFGDTSGFGNDNCAIYANGSRQQINMGTPSGTWLPSGWGDNASYDNATCQRHGVVQQD